MWRTHEDSAQMFLHLHLHFWMHHIIWMEVKLKEASHPLRKCYFLLHLTLADYKTHWGLREIRGVIVVWMNIRQFAA